MQSWLYDISERIEALQAVLDEAEDKSIEPDIKNALTGIYESDIPAAVADGIEYIKRQEKLIAGVDERIKEMTNYKKILENRMKRVKQGYTDFLVVVDQKKVETTSGRMTVAALPESTVIDDAALIPNEYQRTTIKVEPDKTAIKQAIQSGHNVPGAHLEQRKSIRIK